MLAGLAGEGGGDAEMLPASNRHDAEVLRAMVGLASDLVAVVQDAKGLDLACRAGVAQVKPEPYNLSMLRRCGWGTR